MTRLGASGSADVLPMPTGVERTDHLADMRPAKPLYTGLQYARGVAALLVVFYHAAIQANGQFGGTLPTFGKSGVDIFFVLSGFVMWTSTSQRSVSPALFLKRRLARIAPLYWTLTLCAAAIALLAPHLLRSTKFDLPHLVASLCFVPWLNPGMPPGDDQLTPVIIPGWTLNFEMFFYLTFALALWCPIERRMGCLTILIVAAYGLALWARPLGTAPQFYSQGVIFEFLAGAFIANTVGLRAARWPWLSAILLLLAIVALLVGDWARGEGERAIVLGVPAAIIIITVAQIENAGRLPYLGWLNAAGDASYSIYLTHVFVIAGVRNLSVMASAHGLSIDPVAFVGLCLLSSALAGAIAYRFVERPLSRKAKRLLKA